MPVDARTEALAALAGAGDSPLMRSFPQGAIFTWDHELRFLSAGGYGLADVGLSREMLEGRTIFEAFPPETAAAIEPNFRAALRGESATLDVPYEGRSYSLHTSPALDRDGNIVAGMGFTHEVTHARAAEAALRESEQAVRVGEERLRLLVDSTLDYGIFLLDPDGLVTSWNAGAQRLKGYTEAEVLGRHFSIFYPEERRAAGHPQRELEIARAQGRYEEEGWRVRKDGSRFWANVVITAAYGEDDGELRGFSKVTRDLSERRRSETRFEGLLESAPDAMLVVDAGGLIHLVNTQTERLFGYPRGELSGRPIEILVPGWSLARHPHPPTGPQVGPSPAGTADLTGHRKDGSAFPAEITLSPIETPDDLVATLAVRDVTRRRAFEAEVLAARDLAEQAARSRQEFLANMSHEIRTPMNAVIAMTSLLLDTDLDHQQRDHLETVRTSGEHLLAIINDILDYAKIDAGRLVLEELTFQVRPWLRDILHLVATQAQNEGLELLCDVDPRAPAVVAGDPGRLRQILVNLLSNAVKFTQAGEVIVRVALDDARPDDARPEQDRPEQDRLLITVSDTGIGIAPERIEALFDPFTQADSTTTRLHGGTGLGLAISRRLATAMGGQITLDSTPGAGTTASLTVPTRTPTLTAAPLTAVPLTAVPLTAVPLTAAPDAAATAVSVAAGPGPLAGRRMLVVDDNAASRSMLQTWARRHQLTCVSAAGAEQALRLVAGDQDFTFAVIDLLMPGMDGAELGSLLAARLPATRMILLSAAGPDAHSLQPDAEHFDAVLAKPVDQDRLFDLLRTLLVTGTVPAQPPAARTSTFDLPGATRDLSILIVEDAAVNQKVAQHLLTRFGFRSEVAATGLEAIAALEQRDYDLVLMDVQMPHMSGLEATRLIRARWPHRPVQIVAMTANVGPEDAHRCRDAGMDDFLAKPISVPALARILSAFAAPRPAPPPPPPVTTTDEHHLEDLHHRLGHDVVQELVTLFLTDLDLAIPTLAADCRAHDRPALARAAHRLKSSARTLGAQPLGELLHELEQLAPDAEWTELEHLVTRVQAQRQPTHDDLTARLP